MTGVTLGRSESLSLQMRVKPHGRSSELGKVTDSLQGRCGNEDKACQVSEDPGDLWHLTSPGLILPLSPSRTPWLQPPPAHHSESHPLGGFGVRQDLSSNLGSAT